MLACNSFPNVNCGLVAEPCDAILFRRVNDGNAVSMPYAKGFGWGAELNIRNVFEQLFLTEGGAGYPEEWAAAEKKNKKILENVQKVTYRDMLSILKEMDQGFLKETLAEETFPELFFKQCEKGEISDYIHSVLGR